MRKCILLLIVLALTPGCGTTLEQCPDDLDGDGSAGFTTTLYILDGKETCPELSSGDCDDLDAAINPDATEQCDGVDNNCDAIVDSNIDGRLSADEILYLDADSDGYGDTDVSMVTCDEPGYLAWPDGDCDDSNPEIAPNRVEICNEIDDNCDGIIDELNASSPTWYVDADGDGFGDPATLSVSCVQPSGYVASAGDCDDGDAAINSGTEEVCGDSVDQDCDGEDITCPDTGAGDDTADTGV